MGYSQLFQQKEDTISANTIAEYKLNGNFVDSSGNGNNGTAIGSPQPTSNFLGTPNTAIQFDGVNDYGNISPTNFNNLDIIMVSAMVRTTTGGRFISIRTGVSQNQIKLLLTVGGGGVSLISGSPSPLVLSSALYPKVITNGIVNHVIGGVDYPNKTFHIFINGLHVLHEYNANITDYTASTLFALGADPNNAGAYYNGMLDNVRILNKVPTIAEAKALFRQII